MGTTFYINATVYLQCTHSVDICTFLLKSADGLMTYYINAKGPSLHRLCAHISACVAHHLALSPARARLPIILL